MAEIRKIVLLDGIKSYQVGDKLINKKGLQTTIESLYMQSIEVGNTLELLVIRLYVKESGSPSVDIPYHNIGGIFYS